MAKSLLYNTLSAIINTQGRIVERVSGIIINGNATDFLAADGKYHTLNTSAVSANNSQITLKVGTNATENSFTLNQSTSGQITIPSATTSIQGVVKIANSIANDSTTVPTNKAIYELFGDVENQLSLLLNGTNS